MKLIEIFEDKEETLNLPDIEVGDEVKVGRFKNRKATVKGFKKDDHNQPILKTTKGDQKLFKPRISKLEENESRSIPMGFWINPLTNEFFRSTDEHADYVYRNPEKFGIDQALIDDLNVAYKGFERDKWSALMIEVGKNGWVRGGNHISRNMGEIQRGVFLQGDSDDIIHKAALYLLDLGYYYEAIWMDTTFEFFNVSYSTFNYLEGKRMDYWLKTGKWPSRTTTFR